MIKRGTPVKGAKLMMPHIREHSETNVAGEINPGFTSGVLMLGITFKENCPDIRNIKAIDIYPVKLRSNYLQGEPRIVRIRNEHVRYWRKYR